MMNTKFALIAACVTAVVGIVLASAAATAQSGASGPNFSCARAPEGGVEEVICWDPDTSRQDRVLWQWAALKTNPDRAQRLPQKTGTTAGSRPPLGPSFNCARASNSVERLICADRSLSLLDRQMAGLYDRARYRMPPEMDAMLATEQRTFLANRNLCARRINDKVECVTTAYEMRNLRLNEWMGNGLSD